MYIYNQNKGETVMISTIKTDTVIAITKELFFLGIPKTVIANTLELEMSKVKKYLVHCGKEILTDRTANYKKAFPEILKKFADFTSLKLKIQEDVLLRSALSHILEEKKILERLYGVQVALQTLLEIYYPPKKAGYAALLKCVCQKGISSFNGPMLSHSARDFWKEYLEQISSGMAPVPGSLNDLCESAIASYVNQNRASIMPTLTDKIFLRLKQLLATLTPRQEKVLRMRFGINEKRSSLKEVGKEFEISGSYVQTIEFQALRKLRINLTPSDQVLFRQALMPLQVVFDKPHINTDAEQKDSQITNVSLEKLLTPVSELELSFRTAHCLKKCNYRFIGELLTFNT